MYKQFSHSICTLKIVELENFLFAPGSRRLVEPAAQINFLESNDKSHGLLRSDAMKTACGRRM